MTNTIYIRNYDRTHGIADKKSGVLGVDLGKEHYLTRLEDYGNGILIPERTVEGKLISEETMLPSRVWQLTEQDRFGAYFVEVKDEEIIKKVENAFALEDLENQ